MGYVWEGMGAWRRVDLCRRVLCGGLCMGLCVGVHGIRHDGMGFLGVSGIGV